MTCSRIKQKLDLAEDIMKNICEEASLVFDDADTTELPIKKDIRTNLKKIKKKRLKESLSK